MCDEETASLQTSEQIVEYDPKTNKSEVIAHMTGARSGHIMNCIKFKGPVSIQDKLLICGGYEPKGLRNLTDAKLYKTLYNTIHLAIFKNVHRYVT